MTDGPIRVLIVDDSRLTRISLKTTLREAEGFELAGEAEDGRQGVEMAATLCPDIILMDIGMPVLDGIRATQQIKKNYPDMKIVMLTSHEDERDILDAFQSGATSYCLKETPPEMLVHIIRTTIGGACWIDPKIARFVVSRLQPENESAPVDAGESSTLISLTDREMDVLALLAEGKNNTEISDALSISMNTVKTHLKNIFQKLDVEDRTAAALKAIKERII